MCCCAKGAARPGVGVKKRNSVEKTLRFNAKELLDAVQLLAWERRSAFLQDEHQDGAFQNPGEEQLSPNPRGRSPRPGHTGWQRSPDRPEEEITRDHVTRFTGSDSAAASASAPELHANTHASIIRAQRRSLLFSFLSGSIWYKS